MSGGPALVLSGRFTDLLLSGGFAELLSGEFGGRKDQVIENLMIAGIIVGLGFILHEVAHRVVARSYGIVAEFKAYNIMLAIALITSFFGFIIAAPAAIVPRGAVSKRQRGIIALAGPATNMMLAIILAIVARNFPYTEFIGKTSVYGMVLCVWVGVFNMLPISMLDGRAVFYWNKVVYAISVAIGLAIAATLYILWKPDVVGM